MNDNLQVSFEGPRTRDLSGAKYGGNVLLRCSNCNKPLADILITHPNKKIPGTNETFSWDVRAKCCYGCKRYDDSPEYSFIETITGLYHVGGYGVENVNDPGDSTVETIVVNSTEEHSKNGKILVTFDVVKAKNHV